MRKIDIILTTLIVTLTIGTIKIYQPPPTQIEPRDLSEIERLESEELEKQLETEEQIKERPEPINRNRARQETPQELIKRYCEKYGVNYNLAYRIAKAESNLNPNTKNKNSTASGIYQFIKSSWNYYSKLAGRQGESVFNADANIETAIYTIKHYGTSPWNASKSKWNQ